MKHKILSKKVAYRCNWFKIEEAKIKLPTGKLVKWERIIGPDFVVIVAIDKQKNIYLSKEWRFAWEKEILQLPGGTSKGSLLQQARNELREEIGFDAKKWEKLAILPFSAREKRKIHIFLARNLFKSKKKEEDYEIIEVVRMPFRKAYKLLLSSKVLTTGYTVLGMLLAKEKLKL